MKCREWENKQFLSIYLLYGAIVGWITHSQVSHYSMFVVLKGKIKKRRLIWNEPFKAERNLSCVLQGQRKWNHWFFFFFFFRDAPKWKFLAEAKQNETLGRIPSTVFHPHFFLPHVGLFLLFFFFYYYINYIAKISFLLFLSCFSPQKELTWHWTFLTSYQTLYQQSTI